MITEERLIRQGIHKDPDYFICDEDEVSMVYRGGNFQGEAKGWQKKRKGYKQERSAGRKHRHTKKAHCNHPIYNALFSIQVIGLGLAVLLQPEMIKYLHYSKSLIFKK